MRAAPRLARRRAAKASPTAGSAVRTRGQLAAVWLVSALVLGFMLASSAASAGPLDDPDLAQQRAGMLDVVGPRSAAPILSVGLPAPGRVGVVFFVRPAQLDPLLEALAGGEGTRLAGAADLSVVASVLPNGRGAVASSAVPVVDDPDGRLVDGFQMRRPRDGGPPVGYAVVGPDGTVRFRTEDPGVAGRLDEVLTLAEAVP